MYQNKPVRVSHRTKIIITAVICISVGLFVGIGGTLTYYNSKVENIIEETENLQSEQSLELQAKIDTLTAEIDSLNYDVQQMSNTPAQTVEYCRTAYTATNDYSENIQNVAETVMPSVVGVRTVSIQTASSFFYGGRSMSQEVVGVGTGVIVSEDGLILTNQHVVTDDPKSITVTLMDGSEYEAEVIYSDESMDLAVISINAEGLPVASLGDSNSVNVGEITIAIGNPLGLEFERSVTAGIVSALDRVIQLDEYEFATNLIQTDAAINSGNSGGPLLNSSGDVIGINTYKLSYGEGMGFAVPINAAIPIINQVIENGEFTQAKIGGNFIDSNIYSLFNGAELSESGIKNIGYEQGLLALSIKEDSDAYRSGLRDKDILLSIDGEEVNTLLELRTVLYSHLPGDMVTLTLQRDGEAVEIEVELYEAT